MQTALWQASVQESVPASMKTPFNFLQAACAEHLLLGALLNFRAPRAFKAESIQS